MRPTAKVMEHAYWRDDVMDEDFGWAAWQTKEEGKVNNQESRLHAALSDALGGVEGATARVLDKTDWQVSLSFMAYGGADVEMTRDGHWLPIEAKVALGLSAGSNVTLLLAVAQCVTYMDGYARRGPMRCLVSYGIVTSGREWFLVRLELSGDEPKVEVRRIPGTKTDVASVILRALHANALSEEDAELWDLVLDTSDVFASSDTDELPNYVGDGEAFGRAEDACESWARAASSPHRFDPGVYHRRLRAAELLCGRSLRGRMRLTSGAVSLHDYCTGVRRVM